MFHYVLVSLHFSRLILIFRVSFVVDLCLTTNANANTRARAREQQVQLLQHVAQHYKTMLAVPFAFAFESVLLVVIGADIGKRTNAIVSLCAKIKRNETSERLT